MPKSYGGSEDPENKGELVTPDHCLIHAHYLNVYEDLEDAPLALTVVLQNGLLKSHNLNRTLSEDNLGYVGESFVDDDGFQLGVDGERVDDEDDFCDSFGMPKKRRRVSDDPSISEERNGGEEAGSGVARGTDNVPTAKKNACRKDDDDSYSSGSTTGDLTRTHYKDSNCSSSSLYSVSLFSDSSILMIYIFYPSYSS
jgi:hypothetical protein